MQEPVVEPPKVDRRLEPDGSGPVSGARVDGEAAGVTSVRSRVGRAGGHDEVLRGSRGEAAGWVCQSDLAPLGGLVLARCGPTLDQSFPSTFGSSVAAIMKGRGCEGEIESGAV
jgi:hypothetical protein